MSRMTRRNSRCCRGEAGCSANHNKPENRSSFSQIATAHKRFNSIDTLEVEGASISDPNTMKFSILDFYQKVYKEVEDWRPDFSLQGIIDIDSEEHGWLQINFEEEEVFECIKSCASDKAPGPDGFPMSFTKLSGVF